MTETNPVIRLSYIDGVRGWAALFVVLFHVFRESMVNVWPLVSSPWLSIVLDGHLMVFIFFILSGDALSVSFFGSNSLRPTSKIILQRYVRLTIPILVSCLMVFCLMSLGLTFTSDVAELLGRQDWYGRFLNFEPSLYACIKFSLRDVYFEYDKNISYNPFLWTMSVEMLGSLLVFSVLLVISEINKKHRVTFLVGLTILMFFLSATYALFVYGVLLGFLRSAGYLKNKRFRSWLSVGLLCSCLFVSVLQAREFDGFFGYLRKIIEGNFGHAVLASFFVYCIYVIDPIRIFFCGNFSVFLGKISFAMYVLHFPIIVSVYAGGLLYLNSMGYGSDFFMLLLSFFVVSLILISAYFWATLESQYLFL
ncbi:acyltransferase, partial [Sphaerotilus montanus]|uniref:acyltransferase family protein n=1 Tax=Sphaerotilus montanus TaxID=522889 RepID=UPI0015D71C14